MKKLPVLLFCLTIISSGCAVLSNPAKKIYQVPVPDAHLLSVPMQQSFEKGIDFVASGNQPSNWKLEISLDDSIYFKSTDGLSFTIATTKPIQQPDSSTIIESKIDLGQVLIKIKTTACLASVTADQQVECEVFIGQTLYTGCGKYLYNSLLNGSWKLVQFKDLIVQPKNFKQGVPTLSFTLLENKFTGFNGCEKVSGWVQVKGKRIQFAAVSQQPKKCEEILPVKIFEVLAHQFVRYKISNQTLSLYLIDDSVMHFKK